jgi:hypothetical protein
MESEASLREVQELKIVSKDGVHLEQKWNMNTVCSINLVCSMMEEEGGGGSKRYSYRQ